METPHPVNEDIKKTQIGQKLSFKLIENSLELSDDIIELLNFFPELISEK